MAPAIDPTEARNDERHRRVAALLRTDASVLEAARETLHRWLAQDPHPALLEWQAAFLTFEVEDMARFLESSTPRARRMRISSPFVGLAA